MLDKLKNALASARDKVVEQAALGFANGYLEQFGAITRLEINSREKTLSAELALKGETSTIAISAGRYEITSIGEETFIAFYDCRASREWLTVALKQYLEGKPLKIPAKLKLVL
jgi:hypothetical protein